MFSELDSGSRSPGTRTDQVIMLCSWAKYFTLTMLCSIQEYKWVVANCQQSPTGGQGGGGNLEMNFIWGGEVNYS